MSDPTSRSATDAGTTRGGRRAGPRTRRRLGPAAVLAVLVPLGVVGAAALATPDAAETARDQGPARVDLTAQTLVCPPPDGAPAPVTVGRAPGTGSGPVEVVAVGGPDGDEAAPAQEADPADGGASGPVVVPDAPAAVEGMDDAAPGLLAGRFATRTTAGTACTPPAADQWFTGLGAGAERSSVIELVNPDTGPAVADVTLLGPDGPLDVPDVAGVSVPAGDSVSLDLGEVVPTDDDLAARVEVVRGRLGVGVLDRVSALDGTATSEWVPSQPEPATSLVLPGLPAGAGGRSLVVANPGETDTQVTVRVATPGGAVAPVGVRELQVPAGGTETLALGDELAEQIEGDGAGLLLDGAAPVTATLRSTLRGDLALTAAVPARASTAGLVPAGEARVVLAAPADDGARETAVSVLARDEAGEELGSQEVALTPGAAEQVDLPEGTASVSTETVDGAVAASVVVRRGDGTLVLPLAEPVVDRLVPDVGPGLP